MEEDREAAENALPLSVQDGRAVRLCGDLGRKRDEDGQTLRTFAVITTDANALMAQHRCIIACLPCSHERQRKCGWIPPPRGNMYYHSWPPTPPVRCGCMRYRRGSTARRKIPRNSSRRYKKSFSGCLSCLPASSLWCFFSQALCHVWFLFSRVTGKAPEG